MIAFPALSPLLLLSFYRNKSKRIHPFITLCLRPHFVMIMTGGRGGKNEEHGEEQVILHCGSAYDYLVAAVNFFLLLLVQLSRKNKHKKYC